MLLCWFISLPAAHDASRLRTLAERLGHAPGLEAALAHEPGEATDPFLAKEQAPGPVLQLYFGDTAALALAAGRDGAVGSWWRENPEALSDAACQVMETRVIAGDPRRPRQPSCTYLVGYEGPAVNPEAWRQHYLDSHAVLLAALPGVCQVEVYAPLTVVVPLPGRPEHHMQRNKVVFDSGAQLEAALHSSVRARMREDFQRFPPYSGAVTHRPMATRTLTAPDGA